MEIKETCLDHVAGESFATICTGERKFLNLIDRLSQKHPDDVKVVHRNEDGSVVARIPVDWMKIGPKRSVHMTPEQIEAATMRLRNMRDANRKGKERMETNTEGSVSCAAVKNASGMDAAK